MKKLSVLEKALSAGVALLTITAPSVRAQQAGEFSNRSPILINSPRFPQNDGSVLPLAATPYPSTIEVTGFAADAMIENVTVTLRRLSHTAPDDIDMLLVGPDGRNIVIFSDAGGGFFGGGGGLPDPEEIVTIVLDDDAEWPLPQNLPLSSGAFRPSNYELEDDDDPDVFPEPLDENDLPIGPAPQPSTATKLSVFANTQPNGKWLLYVVDDGIFEEGYIAVGWSLTIRTRTQSSSFRRGDADADGKIGLTDAVVTLNALFQGTLWPSCADAADANDDGTVSLTDAVYTLHFLFLGGPVPPSPGPETCGADPTVDGLTCDLYLPCRSECGDTNWDSANCGACGVVCPLGTACSAGVCEGLCVGCEF